MSSKSDQTVAESADQRHQLASSGERVVTMEPASFQRMPDGSRRGRYCAPPAIVFASEAPTCQTCGQIVTWSAPGKRARGGYAYRIRCACGPDVLFWPHRLVMGGPASWWRDRGWTLDDAGH